MNITAMKRQVREYLQENGFNFNYEKMSDSYLRMDTRLIDGMSYIGFNPIAQGISNPPLAPERRVLQNDVFVVLFYALAIRKVAAATPTPAQQTASVLYRYYNPVNFDDATADPNLEAIYQGSSLTLQVNQTEFLPNIDTYRFRRVGTSQNAIVPAGVDGAGDPVSTESGLTDEQEGPLFGYCPTDWVVLRGDATAQYRINFGNDASYDFAVADESRYAVLQARGFLIQNALQKVGK